MVFRVVYEKEILDKITTIRFALILFVAAVIAVVGVVGFQGYYHVGVEEGSRQRTETEKRMREAAAKRLVDLAVVKQKYYIVPRSEELFVSGNEEKYPNLFTFDSFVLDLPKKQETADFLFEKPIVPDLSFLVVVLFSLLALTLSYDAFSGEKSAKTLGLTMSNSLPRSIYLLAKYSAHMTLMALALVVLLLVFLIAAAFNGLPVLNPDFIKILSVFGLLSLVYLSLILLLGMLVSVLIESSAAGMVVVLTIWVVITFLVPATGRFLAEREGELSTERELTEMQEKSKWAVMESFLPEGMDLKSMVKKMMESASSGKPMDDIPAALSWGGPELQRDPEGRCRLETMGAERAHRITVDYLDQQLEMVNKAQSAVNLSPAAAFRYSAENLIGTGTARFSKLLIDLQIYQNILKAFLVSADLADPDSRHLLFPDHDMADYDKYGSQKPVDYESVPQFRETQASISAKIRNSFWSLFYLFFLNMLLFLLCWVSFLRADVR